MDRENVQGIVDFEAEFDQRHGVETDRPTRRSPRRCRQTRWRSRRPATTPSRGPRSRSNASAPTAGYGTAQGRHRTAPNQARSSFKPWRRRSKSTPCRHCRAHCRPKIAMARGSLRSPGQASTFASKSCLCPNITAFSTAPLWRAGRDVTPRPVFINSDARGQAGGCRAGG